MKDLTPAKDTLDPIEIASRDEIRAALIDFHDTGDSYWTPENISKW